MNVQSYLDHIGVTKVEDIKQFLYDIHKYHLLKVPFENLDIINGTRLKLDIHSLLKKIVGNNRGGICFETNTLLHWVLKELGYNVAFISARFWNEEIKAFNPESSHLALTVQLEKLYLVDVGVGGGFLYPLMIEDGYAYSDANGSYKMKQLNNETYVLMNEQDGKWAELFMFTVKPRKLEEFYSQCEYYETSPDTFFTQKPIVSTLTENGRVTLKEDVLKITINGIAKEHPIEAKEEWERVLMELFSIEL